MDSGVRRVGSPTADDEIHLKAVGFLLLRSWLWILSAAAAGAVATAAYNRRAVAVFEAAASIQMSEASRDLPELAVRRTVSTGSQVETEMEVLRSRTLAEEVVDRLGLQLHMVAPKGVARSYLLDSISIDRAAPAGRYQLLRQEGGSFAIVGPSGTSLGPVSASASAALPGARFRLRAQAADFGRITLEVRGREETVQELRDHIITDRPNRDAGIVTVRYQSPDTQLVHDIPNTLISAFIAWRLGVGKTEATSTVGFLAGQVDTLSHQLAAAEDALTAFREGERVVSLDAEARSQVMQLARLQAERNVLETERVALERLVAKIETSPMSPESLAPSPYARLISFPTLYRNPATSELLRSLSEADAQRSRLLERRTAQDPDVMNVTLRVRELEEQLRATATTYLQGLSSQVDAYDRTLTRFGRELEKIPTKEVQLARLERETTVLGDIYVTLQKRLQESRILEAVEDASVRIVDPAILPSKPVRPVKPLNLVIGVLMGGLLGVLVSLAREYLDENVHTRADLQRSMGGAPVLGLIPRMQRARRVRLPGVSPGALEVRLVAGHDRPNAASEAYRTLRMNLTFSDPGRPPKSIVITSPLPREGKSTTAANLSITLAQQEIRALLVDADLRRGILGRAFGVPQQPGLTDVLAGRADIGDAVRDVDLGERGWLRLMPSGHLPPNPAEVLGSARMLALLEILEQRFDLVILDTAPLAVVVDAAVLSTFANGVVLVARASRTSEGAIAHAVEQLHQVQARILGAVLNDVDFRRDVRYTTAYGRYGLPPFSDEHGARK